MSHVFHRHCTHLPPLVDSGQGVYLYDKSGKAYLDASGGAAVSSLGHAHPVITAAVKQQLDKIAYAHTSFFTNEPAEQLATALCEQAPKGLEKVYFGCGGSEAVEAALKLARQYHLERGESQREVFVGRLQSYHGNTLGALAVGGNAWRKALFEPLLIPAQHIAPCYAYRYREDGESLADYGLRAANLLEEKLLETGPERVVAFIAEPVVGATAGAITAAPGYFQRIREICDRYGVLLILDEVMCGMGRTGTLFACEQEGIAPDILITAKGLGAGYQPIAAMLVQQKVFDAVASGSGFFQHGHTYMAHATACAAALAVQKVIKDERLLDQVAARSDYLFQGLKIRFEDHPHVGEIRGRGLFIGIELVADKADKTPFAARLPLHQWIKDEAFAAGLICYPMAGTIDGKTGHHVLLAPPFIISEAQCDELLDKLGRALEAGFAKALAQGGSAA